MKIKITQIVILLIIISLLSRQEITGQCTHCNGSTASSVNVSNVLGPHNKASGYASLASGSNSIASGSQTASIGSFNHASGEKSMTLGHNLVSASDGSVVIGRGFDYRSRLSNNRPNSLMIGFRSIYPTLFVGTSPSIVGTGRVGIGNVTAPEAKLHIRADQREAASLFLEQNDFQQADLYLGNKAHGLQSDHELGLVFRTENNYIFNTGNVGIGTLSPEYDLEVQGKTFTEHFTLFDHELYQEDISGWVLRSDVNGRAVWCSPSSLDDRDWVQKEDNIYRLTGRVGIGTASPQAQLDLADIFPAGGVNLKIGNDAYLTDIDRGHTLGIFSQTDEAIGAVKLGNDGPLLFGKDKMLGIGTREPLTSLELCNPIGQGQTVGMCISNPETFRWFIGMDGNNKYLNDLLIGNMADLGSGFSSFLVMKQNGNVGLGTDDTYGYRLAVKGAIITEEVTVKVHEDWPDHVFDVDYDLLPLDTLEKYISLHGHLPQVPDAMQVSTEGLKLGDMERILLQKVEELTLYVIRQQSLIDDLAQQIGTNQ